MGNLDKGLLPSSPVSEPASHGRQNRRRGSMPLPFPAARQWDYLRFAGILLASIAVFDVLLRLYLVADRQTGKPRPLIAKMQHFAHFIDELRMRVVVPPATGIGKFDKALLPTLDQVQPFAGGTVVRTLLPFRHEGSQTRR